MFAFWILNIYSIDCTNFFPPGIHHISDGVFLSSAEALADMVTEEDLAVGRSKSFNNKKHKSGKHKRRLTKISSSCRLYPPLSNIQEISVQIAKRVTIRHNFLWKQQQMWRLLKKRIKRTRLQHIRNRRTRRLSSGLTSTTTTMIRSALNLFDFINKFLNLKKIFSLLPNSSLQLWNSL